MIYLLDFNSITSTTNREDSPKSQLFFQNMHDDKTESSVSYYEFLRHLNEQTSN